MNEEQRNSLISTIMSLEGEQGWKDFKQIEMLMNLKKKELLSTRPTILQSFMNKNNNKKSIGGFP